MRTIGGLLTVAVALVDSKVLSVVSALVVVEDKPGLIAVVQFVPAAEEEPQIVVLVVVAAVHVGLAHILAEELEEQILIAAMVVPAAEEPFPAVRLGEPWQGVKELVDELSGGRFARAADGAFHDVPTGIYRMA